MLAGYPAVHSEAEAYFQRLIAGRSVTDQNLLDMVRSQPLMLALHRQGFNAMTDPEDWESLITEHGTPEMKALAGPDRDRLMIVLKGLYAGTEHLHIELARMDLDAMRDSFREVSLPRTRSGNIGDEAHRGSASRQADQVVGPVDEPERPCPGTGAFETRCSKQHRL